MARAAAAAAAGARVARFSGVSRVECLAGREVGVVSARKHALVALRSARGFPCCRASSTGPLRGSVSRLAGTSSGSSHSNNDNLFGRMVLSLGLGAVGGAAAYHTLLADVRAHPAYWWLSSEVATPFLHLVDAEIAHRAAIVAAASGLAPREPRGQSPPSLRTSVWGLDFPSAVGLAAGFDKHAEAPAALLHMGFGFVEVGTVTPLPQAGNDKPRVWRLPEDGGVINRYGFNSEGLEAVAERIEQFTDSRSADSSSGMRGPLGVNIGKNKEGDAVMDFVVGAMRMAPRSDYLVVNVSSPNTPGLRDLQRIEPLRELISSVQTAAKKVSEALDQKCPPVLVKIAPDVTHEQLVDVAKVVHELKVDGIIVANTTVDRPLWLTSKERDHPGGLSGVPVRGKSTEVLRELYRLTNGKVPLIGVGGITCGADAYDKVRAGASLVQLYTSLALQGPSVVCRVKRELAELLEADGFSTIAEAVGADHRAEADAVRAAIAQATASKDVSD